VRYFSHIDKFGETRWSRNNNDESWRAGPKACKHAGIFFALKNRRLTEAMTPDELKKKVLACVEKQLDALEDKRANLQTKYKHLLQGA